MKTYVFRSTRNGEIHKVIAASLSLATAAARVHFRCDAYTWEGVEE